MVGVERAEKIWKERTEKIKRIRGATKGKKEGLSREGELVVLRSALEDAHEIVSKVAYGNTSKEGIEAAEVLDKVLFALERTPVARALLQERRRLAREGE